MLIENANTRGEKESNNADGAENREEVEKLLMAENFILPENIKVERYALEDHGSTQGSGGDECSLAKKKDWDMDSILGFGNFHHFQIWVVQTIIAILGATSFFQLVYIVQDPPDDWVCSGGEERCGSEGEVCEGVGEVVFNTSHPNFLHSLVVEHVWVCDQAQRSSNVLMVQGLGMILNSLIFGQLCDRWGRVTVMHITNVIFIVVRMISFFVTDNYPAFLFLTIIGSGFFPVGVRAGYTLMAEFCSQESRKYALISGWVWWVVGMAVIPFIAEALREWYSFALLTTLLNLILVLAIPFVPESPMWLISQGKFNRAADIITKMRRINKDPQIENLPEVLERVATKGQEETPKTLGMVSVLKEPTLLRLTVYMSVLFTVNDFFYLAGQLNAVNLAGNVFLNYSLLALTEMPSVFVGQFCIDRLGRRFCHSVGMFLTTACFLINIILLSTETDETSVVVVSLLARTISNISWFIMWVQSIEVFPTGVRNTGINIGSTVSMAASMSAPYVIDLGNIDKRYTYLVFMCMGSAGMVITFILPETKGLTLPQGVDDVKMMFKKMKYLSIRPWLEDPKKKEAP